MSSSMIHLAITNLLLQDEEFPSATRLYLGCVLPDAGISGNSHLKQEVATNIYTYDLAMFRKRFSKALQEDDLYKGYYLHLIQDMVFRQFLYAEHHFSSLIPGNVEVLHRDYTVLNFRIAEKYHLSSEMIREIDLTHEPICKLAKFDTHSFVKELHAQFQKTDSYPLTVFTEAMADELIEKSFFACREEIRHLTAETSVFDSMKWNIGK